MIKTAAPLAALLGLLAAATLGDAQEGGWLEAVSRLAGERDRAETCIRILLKRGTPEQIDRSSLVYSKAKADNEAVIAGLRTSLALGQQPVSLTTLEAKLQSSTAGLSQFCETVSGLVPPTPEGQNEKGVLDTILKIPFDAIIKPLSDAVAALWNRRNEQDALIKNQIRTELEAARWPNFADVKPAP